MKQLIIIVYKINVDGITRQQSEELITQLTEYNSLLNDEELKENYLIREIWIPVTQTETDVNVIYPVSFDNEQIEQLINNIKTNIENNIKNDNVLDAIN